jgi:uncharacterized protein
VGKLSAYNIAFKGLSPGKHEFDYKIDSRFFELFENSLVDNGEVDVLVVLVKENSVYTLEFQFTGYVSLICDRCLEIYNQPVYYQTRLFLKFSSEDQEESDEIIWLSPEDYQVNVAQLIYEYIVLSLPVRHVHTSTADGKNLCNPEMLAKLKLMTKDVPASPGDDRWKELKKLKNNNLN